MAIREFSELRQQDVGDGADRYHFLLVEGEEVLLEYKSLRDRCVITNKRLITIDIQGLRGKKAEYLNIPFNKVSAFQFESAGTFDLDAELRIWVSGLGEFELEFLKGTDIEQLAKTLSEMIL